MTKENNNDTANKFIPGLVSRSFFAGSPHVAKCIPALTKSIVDDGGGVCFEWETVGSCGERYAIRATGKPEWQLDLVGNRPVARGLEVRCSCPDGQQQAVHSRSIRKIVVCKHGGAALATVLDPAAVCPPNARRGLYPSGGGEMIIDGAPVEKHVYKTTHRGGGRPCDSCGFRKWSIGDRKYIVEHWMVNNGDDPDHRDGREHLCPACAVRRGLPYECFYQNKRAPGRNIEDLVGKITIDSGGVCPGCGNPSVHIPEVKDRALLDDADGKRTTFPVHLLCLSCACDRMRHAPSSGKQPRGKKRKQCS